MSGYALEFNLMVFKTLAMYIALGVISAISASLFTLDAPPSWRPLRKFALTTVVLWAGIFYALLQLQKVKYVKTAFNEAYVAWDFATRFGMKILFVWWIVASVRILIIGGENTKSPQL